MKERTHLLSLLLSLSLSLSLLRSSEGFSPSLSIEGGRNLHGKNRCIFEPKHQQRTCQLSKATSTTTALHFFFSSSPPLETAERIGDSNDDGKLPYIVERVTDVMDDDNKIFSDIAYVCINAFFKEQLNAKPKDRLPPWKQWQISYLMQLQATDLQRRRIRFVDTNVMFVAYEVRPANEANQDETIILDTNQVQNRHKLPSNARTFVRGDLLAFVEVTQRPYGLGSKKRKYAPEGTEPLRPILTNLAVAKVARKSGIGSDLLGWCERHITNAWKLDEVILEVEDFNQNALDFYDKRGYEVVFSDPASRRYDVSGLYLNKVRCTRKILRKSLTPSVEKGSIGPVGDFGNFFQRIRNTVGV